MTMGMVLNRSVSELVCPADKSDAILKQNRNGEVVFDCNDENVEVHPDAEEICDLINNDCDDDVDEDVSNAPLWFLDADGDGFGDFTEVISACEDEDENGPAGYVDNFADCDDSNVAVFPNADEYCNEIDDNCNGVIDEALSVDAQIWYQDADEDGFEAEVVPSQHEPSGFVTYSTDCNDADETINNDAVESCNGIDDDCDGLVDEGADSTAPTGSTTFYTDSDGDGYGDPNVTTLQCSAPSGYVSNAEDCDDSESSVNPATVWYADSDGDLEGDSNVTLSQCTQPNGYVSNSTDCNDGDIFRIQPMLMEMVFPPVLETVMILMPQLI